MLRKDREKDSIAITDCNRIMSWASVRASRYTIFENRLFVGSGRPDDDGIEIVVLF